MSLALDAVAGSTLETVRSDRTLGVVCAVVPAYNEQERIGETVRAILSCKAIARVVVVDDGSGDSTSSVARDAGAEVIRLSHNQGKGSALSSGLESVRSSADVMVLLDADLGASAAECAKLLLPIERGQADMTIGLLPPDIELDQDGEVGAGLGLAVGLAKWLLKRRAGLDLQQPLSGQRAFRRAVADSVVPRIRGGFGSEVGLTLDTVQAGYRILEVETAFRHRVTGSEWADYLHRAKQFIDVARAVVHIRPGVVTTHDAVAQSSASIKLP